MATKILARALRGLSGAFGLPGQVTSPAELELGLPIQPVADAGAFARYGSNANGAIADGWVTVSSQIAVAAAAAYITTQLDVQSGQYGLQPGMTLWVHRVGFWVSGVAGDITTGEFSSAHAYNDQGSGRLGTNGVFSSLLFKGNAISLTNTAGGFVVDSSGQASLISPAPFPVVAGSIFGVSVRRSSGVSGIAWTLHPIVLGRFLPPGVPPLP